ncbi:hypothetical protein EI94DRAFT_1713148, partial [Lactarius quietus]
MEGLLDRVQSSAAGYATLSSSVPTYYLRAPFLILILVLVLVATANHHLLYTLASFIAAALACYTNASH